MRRPAERRRPKRRDFRRLARNLQPSEVTPESLEVCQQVVREQDRLRPLQVGIAGQDYVPVRLRHLDERPHRLPQGSGELVRRIPDEEVEVQGDLVVAAPARV